MKKLIDRFLPHLAIALSLGLLVIAVMHQFNPSLRFLTSTVSMVYYVILAITVIIVAVRHLVLTRGE